MSAAANQAVRVLVVDDDAEILETYRGILEPHGCQLTTAMSVDDGLRLASSRRFDVCVLDRQLGDDLGTDAVPEFKAQSPGLRIIMATAHRDTEAALDALRLGVDDYLVKPFCAEQLRIAIARQAQTRRLETRLKVLEQQSAGSPAAELDSNAPAMQSVLQIARQVARTDANVLILGESGTGKGLLARTIHQWSARRDGNFVTVACPSLNAELLENELFGHRKGAFTGATDSSEGRVAQAEGGSLFLDEVGDFPLALQPKLLRFIQERAYERVGDPCTRHADVRLIAATNHVLADMVQRGQFREDLYYRLNVVALEVPPLRHRAEDLLPLAGWLLERFSLQYGCPARQFSAAAERALSAYGWPGNVRELANVVERAVILSRNDCIDVGDLSIAQINRDPRSAGIGDELSLAELERQHIEAVLKRCSTLEDAAKWLGIDSSTLYRKRKAYGSDPAGTAVGTGIAP